MKIILASSSVTRKSLLERLPIKFEVMCPDIDETPLSDEMPANLAKRLAFLKAQKIAKRIGGAIVIGADTVVMCGTQRLDKPGTVENAIKQLEFLSEKTAYAYTGLCVYNSETLHAQTDVEQYQVNFRQLSQAVIKEYIKRDEPMHCAGSIKAEGLGIALFTAMNGRDPTALLGLPLMLLIDMLIKENIHILGNSNACNSSIQLTEKSG